MERTVRRVPAPDPNITKKKTLRPPEETIKAAVDAYPDAVVHSEGHMTRNAARSAVKRIKAGEGPWGEAGVELLPFVAPNPDHPDRFDVAVAVRLRDAADPR